MKYIINIFSRHLYLVYNITLHIRPKELGSPKLAPLTFTTTATPTAKIAYLINIATTSRAK